MVRPAAEDVARVTSLESRLQEFAIKLGISRDPFAYQIARASQVDGGEGPRRERALYHQFTWFDEAFGFRDDLIVEPMPGGIAVKTPFTCRITPGAASASQRRWQMFPCDSGISLLMVAPAAESIVPSFFLVSGYEADEKWSSDSYDLPAVQVLEMLSGDIANQIDRVVRSAQSLWSFSAVLLVLLMPLLLLMGVLTSLTRDARTRNMR